MLGPKAKPACMRKPSGKENRKQKKEIRKWFMYSYKSNPLEVWQENVLCGRTLTSRWTIGEVIVKSLSDLPVRRWLELWSNSASASGGSVSFRPSASDPSGTCSPPSSPWCCRCCCVFWSLWFAAEVSCRFTSCMYEAKPLVMLCNRGKTERRHQGFSSIGVGVV